MGERDDRQAEAARWIEDAFGPETIANPIQRAARLAEEAAELLQAVGGARDVWERIGGYVWSRPPGAPAQELGGVGLTLLGAAASLGLSADQCEADELARVKSLPIRHFVERQAGKAAAGLDPAPRRR